MKTTRLITLAGLKDLGDRVTLVSFPGAGHLMLVTEPEKVAKAVVKFLK